MEKLSDKEWLALKRYSTAPLSEVWRDAIDIVFLQRPASYTAEQVCAAYNKPKPKPKTKTTGQVSDADKVISGLAQALTDGQVQYAKLEKQLADAKRERGLAIAHDSQPYPTAEAYEKVCAALAEAQKAAKWNHRPVEDALVEALTKARRWIVEDKFQHDNHCAFICNGGPPCDCPVPVIDAALRMAKERQNG